MTKKEKEVRRLEEMRCAQLGAALTHDKITEIDIYSSIWSVIYHLSNSDIDIIRQGPHQAN